MTIYKHDALIRAWLDGQAVQYRNGLLWIDLPSPLEAKKMPHWYVCDEYRLKPITIRLRTALFKGHKIETVRTLEEEIVVERMADFVRWLSDWEEYTL